MIQFFPGKIHDGLTVHLTKNESFADKQAIGVISTLMQNAWNRVSISTLLHFISRTDNFEPIKSFDFTPDFGTFYFVT